MRWLVGAVAVVAVLAIGAVGVRAYQARDVALSAGDRRAWALLAADLDRRCAPPALRASAVVARDRIIDRDVAALISIAQGTPHGWFPDALDGNWKGNRVSWELTQAGRGLSCGRPDLVARLYAAAQALPGGWTPAAPPVAQARFAEAYADLEARCGQARHGRRAPAAVSDDVDTMIAVDSQNPSWELLSSTGLGRRGPAHESLLPDGWGPLGQCGAPGSIRRLAAALRTPPDVVMYGGKPPAGSVPGSGGARPVPPQPPAS